MLKRFLQKLGLLVPASAALLIAADAVLFAYGVFDGQSMRPAITDDKDVAWWKSRLGAEPKATTEPIMPPEGLAARAGTWFHKDGGNGGAGLSGFRMKPYRGLVAYEIIAANNARYPMIRGRTLASENQCAYAMGVALPFIMYERSYVCEQGESPFTLRTAHGGPGL